MDIFELSKGFPRDERFALTDPVRRSSRSVCANTAERYRKRQYPNMLACKLADADAEATETQVWLDFALDCGYLTDETHARLTTCYQEIGRMLAVLIAHPEELAPGGPRRDPDRQG